MLNHISLFAGIGGIDLAAHWAGFQTIQLVERDPFCQKVLQKNFPGVPIHGDITTFDATGFRGRTHLVSGGFPCQPFSHAGKRRGKEDDRHLWPEMLRVIAEAQPTFVLGENVAGFVNLALDDCLFDLEAQGYEAWAFVLPACAVTALHRRDRCFIVARHVAHAERDGRDGAEVGRGLCKSKKEGRMQQFEGCGAEDASDASRKSGSQESSTTCSIRGQRDTRDDAGWSGRGPRPINNWLIPEPKLGRSTDGIPGWLDRGEINEDMQGVWAGAKKKEVQREVGRLDGVQKADLLRQGVHGERICQRCAVRRRDVSLEGKEIARELLRSVWGDQEATRTSHRQQSKEQLSREYPDIVRQLSCYPSPPCQTCWADGSWESGVSRVIAKDSRGLDHNSRLKSLGNAVVPQQVYPILKAIAEELHA